MMAAVVATCEGCGVRIRTSRPEEAVGRTCPKCGTPLAASMARALAESSFADGKPPAAAAVAATPNPPASTASETPAPPRTRAAVLSAQAAALLVVALFVSVALRPARTPHSPPPPVAHSIVPRPPAPRPPAPMPGTEDDWWDAADVPARPTPEPGTTVPPPPTPATFPSRSPVPRPVQVERRGAGVDLAEAPHSILQVPPLRLSPDPDRQGQAQGFPRVPPPPHPFSPGPPSAQRSDTAPPAPAPATTSPSGSPALSSVAGEPRRILVRGDDGQPMVTRVHGEAGNQLVVLLPDGQISWVEGRSFTDKPFVPATFGEMRQALHDAPKAPYRNFQVRQTLHFLIFYRCTEGFAEDSGRLLESLYRGLYTKFNDCGLDVHEAEFPLVAVIYGTEREFRASNKVEPDIEAYYHKFQNRIHLFETGELANVNPEIAAIRQPYTIAHEGTHQILQNIGVHPRLADWPLWLVEGLAEYCAPTTTKKGAEWAGIGIVNPLHMATLSDIKDQVSFARNFNGQPVGPSFRRSTPLVQELITKRDLSPVEYAYAWALTHYLATSKGTSFVDFLKTMAQVPPLKPQSPDDHLSTFREFFGDLAKVDRAVGKHLSGLKYAPLPCYLVMFEQQMPTGLLKRAALVSQSPTMIRHWLTSVESPRGAPPTWQVMTYQTRTQAKLAANQWINAN